MTTHRLVRVELARLEAVAVDWDRPRPRPAGCRPERLRWEWQTARLGTIITWTLEAQQGANGVLVHLDASVADPRHSRLRRGLQRMVLQAWSGRVLADFADQVEANEPAPAPGERFPLASSRGMDSAQFVRLRCKALGSMPGRTPHKRSIW